MSRDDTINMEHYEILFLAQKMCNVCQKLSKRCPGSLCGNVVRKAKEIYYSQFAKDKKVRANGMREKQMIEEMDLVVLNCYRNKYYTDGNSTEQGIIANAINDILPILVSLKNCEYRKQSGWISVDERLPEDVYGKDRKQITVLVCTKSGRVSTSSRVRMMQISRDTWELEYTDIFEWSGQIAKKVTHWMPLPEAPKMKGGAE